MDIEFEAKDIGRRIRSRRQYLKMSQRKLAQAMDESESSVSQWESGKRIPSLRSSLKIAMALKWSIDSLAGYNPPDADLSGNNPAE